MFRADHGVKLRNERQVLGLYERRPWVKLARQRLCGLARAEAVK